MASDAALNRATVTQDGVRVELEYRFIDGASAQAPLMVFLHEGLGSLSAWRDFPERLCNAAGVRGLDYSRAGYGRSTPRPHAERWAPDFMHVQARDALPGLLAALGIDTLATPPWLFGHSDGGSIALLYASMYPDRLAGAIVAAPHVMVEDISVASIAKVREIYRTTDLREKLARHHADPDSAFFGWNDIWLDPAFRAWNIEAALPAIRCPLLAIQGQDDEYGTMAQIDRIAAAMPQAQLLKLERCGHSPHRDQPQAVIEACVRFIASRFSERSEESRAHRSISIDTP